MSKLMNGFDTHAAVSLEARLHSARGTRVFFHLLELDDQRRATEARDNESATARIARRRGWLPIARTPSTRHYVSGLPALNLECPWKRFGDWHTAMWQAPCEEIETKRLWIEAREWATSAVLGADGIYDARGALRRCRAVEHRRSADQRTPAGIRDHTGVRRGTRPGHHRHGAPRVRPRRGRETGTRRDERADRRRSRADEQPHDADRDAGERQLQTEAGVDLDFTGKTGLATPVPERGPCSLRRTPAPSGP